MDQILEEAVKNGDLSPAGVAKALSNINTFDFEGLIPSYEYGPNTSSRVCLLYTSPSPRDRTRSRMPSSACKKKQHNI